MCGHVRQAISEIEEGLALAPKFDADGLVTCVATDARDRRRADGRAHERRGARRTIETGEAWYFSRSRKALWKKGESSGHTQRVIEMRVDCDQDAVWIKVEQAGPGACHTGRRSCFYRAVPLRQGRRVTLEFRDAGRTFDPGDGLRQGPSPRQRPARHFGPLTRFDAEIAVNRPAEIRCNSSALRLHGDGHRGREGGWIMSGRDTAAGASASCW